MDTGAPGSIEDGIPPVEAPKPNPNTPGAGSKVASKADPPIAGTSAGKAGEQKAPGPKQENPESPTAAKPGAAAAGTPAQKTTGPKLDPTANAKVNALLKASREEAQNKPEPTRRSNPKGPAQQEQKSPGPDPKEKIRVPTVDPTTAADPATPLEAAASVGTTHPEGTPEKGAPTHAPPLEVLGEPEQTQATGAEEGKESMATARTPTPTQAQAKEKKKSKHSKKKVDNSSKDQEEIERAWKQVKSQRLRDKCRKGGGLSKRATGIATRRTTARTPARRRGDGEGRGREPNPPKTQKKETTAKEGRLLHHQEEAHHFPSRGPKRWLHHH
ncbi:hypothetical protein NDU88_002006 [Pleurodeles waltl]|uniref:Uncharacterized protein n=1 Tax=Pleurodeles waltl TaxID=8319 RepID=A0AAV7U811_PLEWA|nr:hypothetical protein NDU88_002006 [Pleurodeles waltl]